MFVVFDLDGTLALDEHRRHHLLPAEGGKKDWDAFYAACGGDEPCVPIVTLLGELFLASHTIAIWTGRSEAVRAETDEWFYRHGVPPVTIRMRPVGDHRPDIELKMAWMAEEGRKPDLVFEDRARMVKAWRAQGIVCCQVAPGDF